MGHKLSPIIDINKFQRRLLFNIKDKKYSLYKSILKEKIKIPKLVTMTSEDMLYQSAKLKQRLLNSKKEAIQDLKKVEIRQDSFDYIDKQY